MREDLSPSIRDVWYMISVQILVSTLQVFMTNSLTISARWVFPGRYSKW